jgi:sporulation protein YlmC with PRC-barrel domain
MGGTLMAIELDAKVMTSDGKEVGKIDKLILDPEGGDIHGIVVHKGMFFGRDIEIPLDGIVGQSAGMIEIRYTKDQLDELPTFHEANYTAPPPERSAEFVTGYGYPSGSMLWPSSYSGPMSGESYGHDPVGGVRDEVAAIHHEQDLGNSVIEEGSTVRSRDGEKVGEVHSIAFDALTARPTRLVVRKGFLFTDDVEVPVRLISSVGDGVVYLDAMKDELDQLMRKSATR